MSVPKSPKDFKALVAWTKTQLEEGKKVHCGCVGGHGRTGTFLAALCSEFGAKDAVTYVRQNYCKNAVESSQQTQFLSEHFGVAPAKGAKTGFLSNGDKASAAAARANTAASSRRPRYGADLDKTEVNCTFSWQSAVHGL